uniref:Uncharacterized protein n=1 Tax=Ditylenchus dipsaci TaxID=166011 RepID=A0A915EB61_9BILA
MYVLNEEVEKPYECKIKGEIPDWLSVALLRNGPAQFKFGNTECKHWFDGMSFIQKFEFRIKRCSFRQSS